jgi:hypothetical protein
MRRDFRTTRWAQSITPSHSWLHSFAEQLVSPDIDIVVEGDDSQPDQYLRSSRHLNDLDDPQAVADRSFALKALFDGGPRRALSCDPVCALQLLASDVLRPWLSNRFMAACGGAVAGRAVRRGLIVAESRTARFQIPGRGPVHQEASRRIRANDARAGRPIRLSMGAEERLSG